jgi:hypothetical protein
MKKYVITEAQLEKIFENLSEISWPWSSKVKFTKLPDEDMTNVKPLSFQEFIAKSEEDAQNDPNVGKPDIEANVQAQVSANRGNAYLDKAEDNLLKIAGKHYRNISSYTLMYDKSVLGDGEDLAAIIITIAYFVDKKKYQDVKLKYDKNLIHLNNKNLRALLSDDFTKTQVKINVDPNNPDDIRVHTLNNTIVIHTNKQKVTRKVEINNVLPSTIDKIIAYFNDRSNLDFVNKALPKKIRNIRKSGGQIIVTY